MISEIMEALIAAAEVENGIPPRLLRGLIRAESGGDPQAVGDSGQAVGLCQMHPAACKTIGADWSKMKDPVAAIEAGAKYLAWCHKIVSSPDWSWALAAFNQGPSVIAKAYAYATLVKSYANLD